MPATMMHLFAAHRFLPRGSDGWFLGNILPDCLDFDRERKDRVHFRDIAPEKRLGALIDLGKSLDLQNDFDFGILFHLYLDYLWDNGPQADHRKRYKGQVWFRDYRKELSCAGSRCAQRSPWAKPLWDRIAKAPKEARKSSFALPEEEIRKFLSFNYKWHTEEALPESAEFPDALVDTFTDFAVQDFARFLQEYFPQVTKR